MAQERRSFTEEFKQEAVRRAAARDTTVTQVARELGIHANLLHAWRRQYALAAPDDTDVKSALPLEEEIRRLRRENASLREDREILKKAAAFFAKESR
jgi:transposase